MTLANFERSEVQAFGPSVFFPTHRFSVVTMIDDHKQNVLFRGSAFTFGGVTAQWQQCRRELTFTERNPQPRTANRALYVLQ